MKRAVAAGTATLVASVASWATHRWGATPAEHVATLPGDDLVAGPAIVATRAVTVNASADQVWAWLVQIGQNRGGMYSYDWLENMIGLDIHSTHEIRDEWQRLTVGDRVVLVPEGFASSKGYSLPVASIDPPRSLVLRQSPPEHPWDAVWSFHVRVLDDGRTRLVSRSRSHRHAGMRGIPDLALDTVMDPITWIMTRKMLLGIKQRAEAAAAPDESDDARAGGSSSVRARRESTSGRSIRQRLDDDVATLGLANRPGDSEPVTQADLASLPEPAQRYLRWMGVLGRSRDCSFRARFRGQFRMRPGQRWMPFDAWQFNTSDPVTRLIKMRIDVAGVVPMFGTDSYLHHAGRMHGKVLGLFTVADGAGPEFDLGELVTYVNDAALLAPSMLLTPDVQWQPVDNHSFDITFTDGGNVVTARLVVGDDGRLLNFHTDDRWYAGTKPPTRTRWSTPVEDWTALPTGRPVPARASAVWHFPDGDVTYVRGAFDPSTIEFNIASDPLPVRR